MRNHNLKCPRCLGHSAYQTRGKENDLYYTQKVCPCGWEARKKFMSREFSDMLTERANRLNTP